MITLIEEIQPLWQEHLKAKFPEGYGGEEIEGIDLALLDSDTAGCISTFLRQDGKLDLWRTAILGICCHDLAIVTRKTDGYVSDYFYRLEKMSHLVLVAVAKNTAIAV